MYSAKSVLIFIFSALFLIACNRAENPTATINGSSSAANTTAQTAQVDEKLIAARKIYDESCIKCHKADGTGGAVDIEGKKYKAPNFTSERQKKESDAEYLDIIENGETGEGMPAFKGKISDENIKNLVKYIRNEFQKASN